jgi:hypothetical protein
MAVILGLSPGTRSFGVSLVRNGELIRWQIIYFPGKWSQKKLKKILNSVLKWIYRNNVDVVAVKLPDNIPISKAYVDMMKALNSEFINQQCKAFYFSLSEIKKILEPDYKITKKGIGEIIIQKYPDLNLSHTNSNHHEKYTRLYEATAVASLINQKMRL